MDKLIEQFENETELRATWSNCGMGGYTKEYTEWLAEKVVNSNAVLPDVRCFKTYGESIIKELGFDLEHVYEHDQFHTNRYRKGLLMVEFTYKGFTLKTVDLTIDETFCKPITYAELQALTPVLGEITE